MIVTTEDNQCAVKWYTEISPCSRIAFRTDENEAYHRKYIDSDAAIISDFGCQGKDRDLAFSDTWMRIETKIETYNIR